MTESGKTAAETALDSIWNRLYPGDRPWAYPAEVSRHVAAAIDEYEETISALKSLLKERSS